MNEIAQRRSVRKYTAKPVSDEILKEILQSAMLAPSGNNTQPWHFIVVDNPELKTRIARTSHNQKWMEKAPLFLVCVADIRARIKNNDEIVVDEESGLFELKQVIRDTAISVEHLVLEAVHQGLGTCWVAWYEQDEIRRVLNIPPDKFVVGIVTLGYADETPAPRPRKKLDEVLHRNSW